MCAFSIMTLTAVLMISPRAGAAGPESVEPTYQGRSVHAWIKALQDSSDPRIRSKALDALAQLGTKAVAAVPALGAALKDRDEAVRIGAAAALRQVGPAARAAVPALLGACKDTSGWVRLMAAGALWQIERRTEYVVPVFKGCLRDKNFRVRGWATRGLAAMGHGAKDAVPALTDELRDENRYVRVDAARALWKIEHKIEPALPILSAACRGKDQSVQVLANGFLEEFLAEARQETGTLKKVFTYSDAALRAAAIQALVLPPPQMWPWLKQTLADPAPSVRVAALDTLVRMDMVNDGQAVPWLRRALHDPAAEVRRAVCRILGKNWTVSKFGDPSTIRVFRHALDKAIEDKDTQVRAYAALALVQVEPKRSGAVVRQLVEALGLPDREAVLRAVEALDHVGQPAVQPLLAALKNRDTHVRAQAAFVLGDLGPKARRAVPALVELLKDKDADTRQAAARALKRIDPEAARKAGVVVPVVPPLQLGQSYPIRNRPDVASSAFTK